MAKKKAKPSKTKCCALRAGLPKMNRCRGLIEPGVSKRVGFVVCGRRGKKTFAEVPSRKQCMGYNPSTKHFEFRSCR